MLSSLRVTGDTWAEGRLHTLRAPMFDARHGHMTSKLKGVKDDNASKKPVLPPPFQFLATTLIVLIALTVKRVLNVSQV